MSAPRTTAKRFAHPRTSRQVRLRRTLAVTLALVLLAALGVRHLLQDDTPAPVKAVPAGGSTTTTAPTASRTTATPNPEDGSSATETPAVDEASVPEHGNGKISVVPVPDAKEATSGRAVRYTVEVEGGLGVDTTQVAGTVQAVLLDSRGWQGVDGIHFVNVSPAEAAKGAPVDIRVTLASPSLTDKLCAPMQTLSQVSCWNGERSVLNLRRWMLGDDSYGTDVARYRMYQVNHEVGHGLGHQHRQCPQKGKRAPVMVQQTLSLGGCSPWPFPSGA
ncbi:DUF3152 domain-containing protein [Pedococcus sp. 2YAF34]|uniref:DUF3152 domain-containing protein n=1 Tax=Pedococcus sp. 2YAF34 TaxID=3233032 RepID=UPI003F96DB06